jgi:lipoprotein-anchoring transpeptidase ErfK/SrfK
MKRFASAAFLLAVLFAGPTIAQGLPPGWRFLPPPGNIHPSPPPPPAPPVYPSSMAAPSPVVRQVVAIVLNEPVGTIVVDTRAHFLYLVIDSGQALRYGIGVARTGFEWSGTHRVTRMAEWPSWTPPAEMLKRSPELPRHMAGGLDNPLGARALYLGSTLYRIHGTNEPWTIGQNVSSGCIRMTNDDVIDLYNRVKLSTRVVVLS